LQPPISHSAVAVDASDYRVFANRGAPADCAGRGDRIGGRRPDGFDHITRTHNALIFGADIYRKYDKALHVRFDLEFFAKARVELRKRDAKYAAAARSAIAARC
jgi:hypothetical protein